jgi:hypothetical protein
MANTYTLLETVTVGAAGASSIVFNSIPQTGYTDLVIKVSTRSSTSATLANLKITFNDGSGGTYTRKELYIENGAYGAEQVSDNIVGDTSGNNATASVFGAAEVYIPNYTSSNTKCFSVDSASENNIVNSGMWMLGGLWSLTAAINKITIFPSTATWMQHSTFSLYGISALGTTPTKAPKATGGDIIMTDGTYWSHTFLSSGTFTPATALSCDYLVVAGGGGGGYVAGGGGGAGGFRTSTGFSCSSGVGLTVTVGAGGAGATSSNSGATGSNSVFSTITSDGGGGGAYFNGANAVNGLTGGSGGGSGGLGSASGGTATSGQGNAGGGSNGSSGAGGGGGASVAGLTGFTTEQGGYGGNGTANSYSGSSVTYAGGGGGSGGAATKGGAGGSGGGGVGGSGSGSNPGAGTANLGGGGGGVWNSATGANGGSGVVIIRYLA